MTEMETITGEIARVRYRSEDGWGIAVLCDKTIVAGTLPPDATETSRSIWRFMGEWVDHVKYGRQFKFSSMVREVPAGGVALAEYIDEICPDVGPKRARAIVDRYGSKAMETLKANPELVAKEISGITLARATAIRDALLASQEDEVLTLGLLQHLGQDGTQGLIKRIKDRWGKDALARLQDDPYILTELWGVGFGTADRIALHHGMSPNDARRGLAALRHVIEVVAPGEGHTSLAMNDAIYDAWMLIGQPYNDVEQHLNDAIEHGHFIAEGDDVYAPDFFEAEHRIADWIVELSRSHPNVQPTVTEAPADLAPDQQCAFDLIMKNCVSVLTGAPGTGKTHTMRYVLHAFDGTGARVALVAPSGKAAKRLSELTGVSASTIHRLLKPCKTRNGFAFTVGMGGDCPACHGSGMHDGVYCGFCNGGGVRLPLNLDLLVIDEFSMTDLKLAWALFQSVTRGCRVLIVGDYYQLPSVGAGNVLEDVLAVLPHTELREIKRQSEGSRIVQACHQIKDGKPYPWTAEKGTDLAFVVAQTEEGIIEVIRKSIIERLPSMGFDPQRDVQVITALRKNTTIGTVQLNKKIQEIFNRVPTSGAFAEGDKVIQLKNGFLASANNFDSGQIPVVNGDIGTVLKIDAGKKKMTVRFENPERDAIVPTVGEECNIDLAYAVTVHKFQGSEAPVIILPIHSCYGPLVAQRNWLYTGISRAKKLCIVVGQEYEFERIISRMSARRRHTRLKEKLAARFEVFSA